MGLPWPGQETGHNMGRCRGRVRRPATTWVAAVAGSGRPATTWIAAVAGSGDRPTLLWHGLRTVPLIADRRSPSRCRGRVRRPATTWAGLRGRPRHRVTKAGTSNGFDFPKPDRILRRLGVRAVREIGSDVPKLSQNVPEKKILPARRSSSNEFSNPRLGFLPKRTSTSARSSSSSSSSTSARPSTAQGTALHPAQGTALRPAQRSISSSCAKARLGLPYVINEPECYGKRD